LKANLILNFSPHSGLVERPKDLNEKVCVRENSIGIKRGELSALLKEKIVFRGVIGLD